MARLGLNSQKHVKPPHELKIHFSETYVVLKIAYTLKS